MNIRSAFLCICLLIHCCNHYNEAASTDEQDLSKKRSRRWTTDEEKDLIFFDVSTDTGEPNHFARIRDMWRQEYPESTVTDIALRAKIRKLRKESQDEGETRNYFKWDEKLDRELLDVYRNTSPYKRNVNVTLEEEWRRRHPDLRSSRRYLLMHVWELFRRNKYPELRLPASSEATSLGDNERSNDWIRHKWTTKWTDRLRNLDKLTNTGERYQFERIKSKWFEEYPNSNVSDLALQSQLHRIRRELQERGERTRQLRWNEKSERELLDIYFKTFPYRTDVDITLEDEWKRRYPGHRAKRSYLADRAQKLLRENKYPEYRAQESASANLQWDVKHDPDLMHIYIMNRVKGGPYLRRTQQLWSGLHPQYEHVTPKQIKERLNHLEMNPPNESFPWSEEENRELLEIYDETMPNKEDQGQRIYEIWSQRHPRYKFMTPYYLQIHASTLARSREVKVAASRKVKSGWTDEEKADLIDMVRQYPRNQQDGLHAFHKEWVRKHPRLAYKYNKELLNLAKRFEKTGNRPQSLEVGEGSSSEVFNSSLHEGNKYKKDDKYCDKSYPFESRSMKPLYRKREERGPDRRADKAPIVYSSDESGPSSPPMMPDDYE